MRLTRQEIEQRLEKRYLGAVVSIELPWTSLNEDQPSSKTYKVSTKIQRIAVEVHEGEAIVVFTGSAGVQYKADVNYFIENITIHGNTHTRGATGGGLQEGD